MIRSPWLWVLCGPVVGVGLVIGQPPLPWLFKVYLFLNSAHLISPVVMAWVHRGFRPAMLADKGRFVFLPLAMLAIAAVVGYTCTKAFQVHPLTLGIDTTDWTDYLRPLVWVYVGYFFWNAYHFSMQNFGMMRLYWPDGDRAEQMKWAMYVTLFGFMIVIQKFHLPLISYFCIGAFMLNHQLIAIAMASHVLGRHWGCNPAWFVAALLVAGGGITGLILLAPVYVSVQSVMVLVALRLAAAFVHFIYDREVWKFSDPRVRNTIGVAFHERREICGAIARRTNGGSRGDFSPRRRSMDAA